MTCKDNGKLAKNCRFMELYKPTEATGTKESLMMTWRFRNWELWPCLYLQEKTLEIFI